MDAPRTPKHPPPGIRRLPWVLLYGAAMGYLEAVVVVYLRAIYYPGGFGLPLVPLATEHLRAEVGREAATLVMLAAVAILAGADRWRRLLAFLILFGLWDLVYYGALRLLVGWPAHLGTWDLLFLIPVPWFAPVWAPMLAALSMVVLGLLLAPYPLRRGGVGPGLSAGFVLGALVIFLALTAEGWWRLLRGENALATQPALPFPWWGVLGGLALVWVLALRLRASGRAEMCRP